jgi:hypothetical protein
MKRLGLIVCVLIMATTPAVAGERPYLRLHEARRVARTLVLIPLARITLDDRQTVKKCRRRSSTVVACRAVLWGANDCRLHAIVVREPKTYAVYVRRLRCS